MITKKLAAPKLWRFGEKHRKFVITPSPGPHSKERCIPLGTIIRDIFGYAETLKEAKQILNQGVVKVNGRVRKSHKFPVGIFDILEIGKEKYLVLPRKTRFEFVKTEKNERIAKIVDKTYVKGSKVQLNLFDGTNILVDDGSKYKTLDSVVLDFDNNIKRHIKFGKGVKAMIIGGKNTGKTGVIKERRITRSSKPNVVVLEIEGRDIEVPQDYVFVVGDYL